MPISSCCCFFKLKQRTRASARPSSLDLSAKTVVTPVRIASGRGAPGGNSAHRYTPGKALSPWKLKEINSLADNRHGCRLAFRKHPRSGFDTLV